LAENDIPKARLVLAHTVQPEKALKECIVDGLTHNSIVILTAARGLIPAPQWRKYLYRACFESRIWDHLIIHRIMQIDEWDDEELIEAAWQWHYTSTIGCGTQISGKFVQCRGCEVRFALQNAKS
jgi:hypothetical protein